MACDLFNHIPPGSQALGQSSPRDKHGNMMSSNGDISRVTRLCEGNSPVTGEFPSQRPVTLSFDVFFDVRLNKRLSKQPRYRWFEMPWRSLWRHGDEINRHQTNTNTTQHETFFLKETRFFFVLKSNPIQSNQFIAMSIHNMVRSIHKFTHSNGGYRSLGLLVPRTH